MDIVYILGTGSVWQDNEIRYSLRSVFKNVLDLGNIFVVGEFPGWLQGVSHIPCRDDFGAKWRNAYMKTRAACENPNISENFLLMNDDFFILEPIKAAEYPYYYSTKILLKNSLKKARFKTTPHLTAARLPVKRKNFLNFAVHRPVRINKKMYLEMPEPELKMLGFSPRAYYCNYYNLPGVGYRERNLQPRCREKDIEKMTKGQTDISMFSMTARSPVFQNWIKRKFPNPSAYEKV